MPILLEDGSNLLLEDGSNLLLEDEESIFPLFEEELANLIQTNLDVYVWSDRIPQGNENRPAIVFTEVSSVGFVKISQASGTVGRWYQFDVYSSDPKTSGIVRDRLRVFLQRFRGKMKNLPIDNVVILPRTGGFDPLGGDSDDGNYRRVIEARIWTREPVPSPMTD